MNGDKPKVIDFSGAAIIARLDKLESDVARLQVEVDRLRSQAQER